MNDESIFAEARQIPAGPKRQAFLNKACSGNDDRLSRIAALLAEDDQPDSFLERNGGDPLNSTQARNNAPAEQSDQIGPYKLIHLLGEGGMGTVWLAEQQQPLKRRVAVKLIKRGLNSQQFIARFEAERQALAMMDHPNIAKVLDAGCSEDGRNYFVMEYVKGIPITQFCDDNRLNTEERLKLFIQVCQAVQHAHQKGVIHRDLKPSNVMVAMYDDQPVPKVIDFGVAKATHQPLTEHTLCTIPGQIVGTWEYMSPEQAILNQLDVDTRTDVYSLGVILYELLTGQTPLDLKSLKPEMLEERLRRIRDQDPAKPSNRVSSLGEALAATAAYRSTEANTLSRSMQGDLDTIVMKALEKDRSQRFETANGFAAEVQRFINDEPLTIRPPTTLQRIGRSYRRNKLVVLAASAVIAALMIGLFIAVLALARMKDSERRADALLENYLESLTDSGLLYAFSGNFEETNRRADEIESVNQSLGNTRQRARPDVLRGLAKFWSGDTTSARQYLEKANRENPDSIAAKAVLAVVYSFGNEFDEYLELGSEVIASSDRAVDDFDRLFIGSVQVLRDSASAVKELEQVIKNKPNWAVARGTYADALSHKALVYGDLVTAEKAIAEMKRAQHLATDIPYLKMADVFIHNVALSLVDPNSAQYNEWTAETKQAIEFLKLYPDYDIARVCENWFFLNFGSEDEKRKSSEVLLKTEVYPWSATAYLMQHDLELVISLLQNKNAKTSPYSPGCLALAKLYNGKGNRETEIKNLTQLLYGDFQWEGKIQILEVLALARDPELVAKAKRLQETVNLPEFECFPFASIVDVFAKNFANVDAVKSYVQTKRSQNRYQIGYLYYCAGLGLLGKDLESDALECFELAVKQSQINSGAHYLSKAFVNKLKLQQK